MVFLHNKLNSTNMARNTTISFSSTSGRVALSNARICFEPNAYDGNETARRNIVFEVTDYVKTIIEGWDVGVDRTKLSSAITTHGIRSKLDPQSVRCWQDKKVVPLPDGLKGNTCNAVLGLHGIWNTKSQSGLNLMCKDIEIIPTIA